MARRRFGLNEVLFGLLVLGVVIGLAVFMMKPKISTQMVGSVKDNDCANCMYNCKDTYINCYSHCMPVCAR